MATNSTSTDQEKRLHTTDYLTSFDTEAYLSAYAFFEVNESFDLFLREIIRAFVTNKKRLGHERALEFGGGPTLYASVIIAQFVDSIHFTDYTPSNLTAIKDWMNEEENAHDWSEMFEFILQEYQKQTGDNAGELYEWENRLRDALKKGKISTTGDVNVSNCPVLDNPANLNQYDVILSTLCLEDACLNYDVYKSTVKRLSALLKPGGFILLTHGRNQSFYNNLDKTFFALAIDEQKMKETYEHAGLVDIHVVGIKKSRDQFADADGFLVGYAFKK